MRGCDIWVAMDLYDTTQSRKGAGNYCEALLGCWGLLEALGVPGAKREAPGVSIWGGGRATAREEAAAAAGAMRRTGGRTRGTQVPHPSRPPRPGSCGHAASACWPDECSLHANPLLAEQLAVHTTLCSSAASAGPDQISTKARTSQRRGGPLQPAARTPHWIARRSWCVPCFSRPNASV